MAERITVVLNGVATELPAGTTVAEAAARLGASAPGVAVAVDRAVVPRSDWDHVVLHPGAAVEVVTAAAGG